MKAVDIMHIFNDYYNNQVTISSADQPFSQDPRHVWVICQYENKWLLTQHKKRGFEFPGGKVEVNEKANEAAVREVKEETGGSVSHLHYIGQYCVKGKTETIIKNIYFAIIDELVEQPSYYETAGPLTMERLPHDIKNEKDFSFIMKDDVLTFALHHIKKENLQIE